MSVIDELLSIHQQRRNNIPSEWISEHSTSGTEFAAGILYARYLGMNVSGSVPGWVNRLQYSPSFCNLIAFGRVQSFLARYGVQIKDRDIVLIR